MKDYIQKTALEAQTRGLPMIRGMFLEFPEDAAAWEVDDQYMFGADYLVAPITEYGARARRIYLPQGQWQAMDSDEIIHSTGEFITASAPLDYMPVYKRIRRP